MPEPSLHTLPGGLTVLLAPDPSAQTVAMGYFVRTGARDDPPGGRGSAHFLEHLMFKGNQEVGGAELNMRLDRLGGGANAFTSDEATVYHAASLPEEQGELLFLLSQLLAPALREEDVELERGVILEEIAMYADQPESRVYDALRAAYWGEHELGQPVLGSVASVSGLTPADLRGTLAARYGAPAVTLVAAGRLDEGKVLAGVRELTRGWSQTTSGRRLSPHTPRPAFLALPDESLSRLQVALASPGISASHPLREAAQVLCEILGGENGRLYWALLDSGLADSADLGHSEYQETGVFEGGFSCDPERGPEVLTLYREVLRGVQQGGVTPQEVRRAARKLAVAAVMGAETPQGQLFGLGMNYLALGRVVTVQEAVGRVAGVTPADVAALLALRPFDTQVTVALGGAGALEGLEALPE